MIELIVIIIIIVSVASNMKKKKASSGSKPAKARPAQPKSSQPVRAQPQVQVPTPERSPAQADAAPFRSARNTGERYDDWFPVPDGKTVVRCHYCGADNLIPNKSNPKYYSCYFCREDL